MLINPFQGFNAVNDGSNGQSYVWYATSSAHRCVGRNIQSSAGNAARAHEACALLPAASPLISDLYLSYGSSYAVFTKRQQILSCQPYAMMVLSLVLYLQFFLLGCLCIPAPTDLERCSSSNQSPGLPPLKHSHCHQSLVVEGLTHSDNGGLYTHGSLGAHAEHVRRQDQGTAATSPTTNVTQPIGTGVPSNTTSIATQSAGTISPTGVASTTTQGAATIEPTGVATNSTQSASATPSNSATNSTLPASISAPTNMTTPSTAPTSTIAPSNSTTNTTQPSGIAAPVDTSLPTAIVPINSTMAASLSTGIAANTTSATLPTGIVAPVGTSVSIEPSSSSNSTSSSATSGISSSTTPSTSSSRPGASATSTSPTATAAPVDTATSARTSSSTTTGIDPSGIAAPVNTFTSTASSSPVPSSVAITTSSTLGTEPSGIAAPVNTSTSTASSSATPIASFTSPSSVAQPTRQPWRPYSWYPNRPPSEVGDGVDPPYFPPRGRYRGWFSSFRGWNAPPAGDGVD
jgi:hypothetical protein